jgi:integrase
MNYQRQITLDRSTVAKLKLDAGKSDQIFFDDELHGFGHRLRNTNGRLRRSWIVQYRIKGRTRRMKIGDAAKVDADAARKKAKDILAAVQLKQDPQGEKEAERAKGAHTLRSVATDYLAMRELAVRRGEYRHNSYRTTKIYLTGKRYFGPLHSTSIHDITVSDIASRLNAINRGSGTVTASRARSALSGLFSWAIHEGLLGKNPHNPVTVTKDPDDKKSRDLVLSGEEIALVWRACDGDDFGRITKLLILTGCRRDEIGGLRWSEVDRDTDTITLPGERVKNGREHVLPITPMMAAVLDSIPPPVDGRELVFGDRSAGGYTGWRRGKQALDLRLAGKLKGKSASFRLHDLRRSAATGMVDLGIEPHHVEAVLNHFSGHRAGVAGIYNRSRYTAQIQAALTLWDSHIRALVEGRARKVVAISTGRNRERVSA